MLLKNASRSVGAGNMIDLSFLKSVGGDSEVEFNLAASRESYYKLQFFISSLSKRSLG